ncbi:unnamed protein product [Chondrus crispus]|uniref:Uncharacterized protein n=1 Tax=Chondrus crispus TaxID=2769 RepID=R7QGZ1_CHOCR|nr:unnamed protein product [Chondrus crispus]CDF37349.1 unnamed protein product [Chondrus crispus]|eukprot:XP_005717168.1 unnamed protein product [Chondrus crispus]
MGELSDLLGSREITCLRVSFAVQRFKKRGENFSQQLAYRTNLRKASLNSNLVSRIGIRSKPPPFERVYTKLSASQGHPLHTNLSRYKGEP